MHITQWLKIRAGRYYSNAQVYGVAFAREISSVVAKNKRDCGEVHSQSLHPEVACHIGSHIICQGKSPG